MTHDVLHFLRLSQRRARLSRRAFVTVLLLPAIVAQVLLASCGGGGSESGGAAAGGGASGPQGLTIGVAFETLQTEFWVAALDALKKRAAEKNIRLLEAVADGDASRQFDQMRTFITRQVDGIILVPKDGKTVIPMIRAANAAKIPVVLLNRPADPTDAPHTVVAPDNVTITKDTVAYLIEQARKAMPADKKIKAAILVGDLSDVNAVGRRDGFEQAVEAAGGANAIEVVARIPTDWNQEKALAGLHSALQAHPDISLIFSSSDFMFPSVRSVLNGLGRWKKANEPGHVTVGGFDGDATAFRLIADGYVDATGVQDVFFEVDAALQAIADAKAGRTPAGRIPDPGFVFTQANRASLEGRMWGAVVAKTAR